METEFGLQGEPPQTRPAPQPRVVEVDPDAIRAQAQAQARQAHTASATDGRPDWFVERFAGARNPDLHLNHGDPATATATATATRGRQCLGRLGLCCDAQAGRRKRIRAFYEAQNAQIERFEGGLLLSSPSTTALAAGNLEGDGGDGDGDGGAGVARAAAISFGVNVLLLAIKVVAVALSGSLSVISSLVDSALDLFSGIVIYVSERQQQDLDPHAFPVGKSRLEPIAVIIISATMSTAAFQLILTSVRELVGGVTAVDLDTVSIVLICLTVGLKVLLFLYCRGIPSPATRALAVDHLNDSISNSIALGAAIWSSRTFPEADAAGAVIIALIIIVSWVREGGVHVNNLVGRASDTPFLQYITFLAYTHDPRVKEVDTVRGYQLGNRAFVEVDLVLDPQMPLGAAHGIGESLQQRLEGLPDVERAFVHLDVDSHHRPEHTYPV